MSTTPESEWDVLPVDEEHPVSYAEKRAVAEARETGKRAIYKIPLRPLRLQDVIENDDLALITTMPSLERAPILQGARARERATGSDEAIRGEQAAASETRAEDGGRNQAVPVPTPMVEGTAGTMDQLPVKKKSMSKRLMFFLRLGITLALVVLIVKGVSWGEIISIYSHAHLTDVLVSLCVGTLGVVFSAYLWHRLVHAENIKADMARLTSLYLIGVAFSNFLPSSMGGDAVKAFYVGRDSGNIAGSASAVLMSRITGFVGMLLVAMPVLIFLHASFNGVLVQRFMLLCLFFIAGFGGAFTLGAFLPKIQGKYLKGAWASNKIVVKGIETGIALTRSLRRPRSLLEAVSFGFLFWICNCLNYYECAVALGVHTPFRFYLIAVPFIGIVGALPISISGYGVREGLVEYLYSTIHIPASTALAVVLLMDMQRLLFSFVGGFLFLTMDNKAKHRS